MDRSYLFTSKLRRILVSFAIAPLITGCGEKESRPVIPGDIAYLESGTLASSPEQDKTPVKSWYVQFNASFATVNSSLDDEMRADGGWRQLGIKDGEVASYEKQLDDGVLRVLVIKGKRDLGPNGPLSHDENWTTVLVTPPPN